MNRLILLRHGESLWNLNNIFTGWVDVPLSQKGIQEALEAGEKIKESPIDVVFTTPLIRASMTAMLALSKHQSRKTPVILHPNEGKMEEWAIINDPKIKSEIIPVHIAWQLNERMYGSLQGLNKKEMMEKFGKEQVQKWRRSFDMAPPQGESLKMTAERSLPYFKKNILPYLEKGQNVLISAHGNSLRSIIMELDQLSSTEVVSLEIPTGRPIIYQFEKGRFIKSE